MYFLFLLSRIHPHGFIVTDSVQLCAIVGVNFIGCMGNSREIGTGGT